MRPLLLALVVLTGSCASRTVVDAASLERAGTFASGVEPARLMADVEALVASHLEDTPVDCAALEVDYVNTTRRPVCHLTRNKARALVRERLESLGYTVTTHDVEEANFLTSNVIAEVRGTQYPDEVVLVGAHYDAFYAGADDNSSGVAALFELARLVAGQRFARTVRFVGFDLEEFGLVGSVRYVNAGGGEKVVAALVFDCIGYKDARTGGQQGLPGFPVPAEGDFLAAIGNETSRTRLEELYTLGRKLGYVPVQGVVTPGDGSGPASGNLMRSDHAPFWLAGHNALFLTDTANFRNPNYHKASDVPATLDADFLAGVTRLSAASLSFWAEGPLP